MSSDPEEMEDDSATRLLSTSTADGGAYLLAVQGSAMGLMVKVTDGLVVGRGKDAGFRIPDDQISRAHLRIRISAAGTVRVKDLGSRNGTLVNGQMVSAARLTAGDRIRIGGTVLAYTDVEGLEATLNRLRKMISDELSEHTDDISQFAEILQVAPTIFSAFVDEANLAAGRLEDLLETDHDSQRLAAAARSVHTLKGNARSLGLNFIGGRAHAIEELMARIGDSRASWRQREALADLLDDLRRAIRRASLIREQLNRSSAKPVTGLDLEHYERLARVHGLLRVAIAATPDHEALLALESAAAELGEMARIPLRSLFDYLRATVTTVAHDAACEAPVVAVEGAEVAVAPPIYRALTEAVPHLVRNAVIHGLEAGEERVESGKPAVGTITIRAARQGAALTVAVADDGRGLQLERLRERAGQLGLPTPSSPEASADLVFTPGLTTVGQASVDRGRGVGAKAAKDAIETVGGRIGVRRNEGAGTVFEITIEDFSVQERPVARTEGDDTCSS